MINFYKRFFYTKPAYTEEQKVLIRNSPLNFRSFWDAEANIPQLQDSATCRGSYFRINVPGKTVLNGLAADMITPVVLTDWIVGDIVVSNGKQWIRIKDQNLKDFGIL